MKPVYWLASNSVPKRWRDGGREILRRRNVHNITRTLSDAFQIFVKAFGACTRENVLLDFFKAKN